MRRIFILVPSMVATGPIKGAMAFANEAAKSRDVTIVSLKSGFHAQLPLDPRVRRVSLSDKSSFLARVRAYRALLAGAGEREDIASFSFCFSGDAVNRFCRSFAWTCASIRSNLFANYRYDHGPIGLIAAWAHFKSLCGFDEAIAMTQVMAGQISPYLRRQPVVIGNFVDEAPLEAFRQEGARTGALRFAFLASLSERKQPLALIRAVAVLAQRGEEVMLDIIGKGKLRAVCEAEVERLGLGRRVVFHGQMVNPYPVLAVADAMVLPSLAEGVSRASLEALHLGVPCVLRDVDGNGELILGAAQGRLFRLEEELPDLMLAVAQDSRARAGRRSSLLPEAFRQASCVQAYLDLAERA